MQVAEVLCQSHFWDSFPKHFQGLMRILLCAHFEVDAILIAVGITAGVTFGLTIFAFQTKIDFTACGGKDKIIYRH